jgi:hypothetical protein
MSVLLWRKAVTGVWLKSDACNGWQSDNARRPASVIEVFVAEGRQTLERGGGMTGSHGGSKYDDFER